MAIKIAETCSQRLLTKTAFAVCVPVGEGRLGRCWCSFQLPLQEVEFTMTLAELVRQIKKNENYWSGLEITPQQIEALTNLSPEEYDNVVCTFMQEPVRDYTELQGVAYRETYAHLVYGSILSI
ncbi:MAG TPA: hypothetical protein ENK32_02925, partial [Anaerolineae bacterium]|nr:hypothetical protein [Anaerolineae bacterium]